jgi:hypothetical protein
MHRGGLLCAVIGMVLTVAGIACDPWLDFKASDSTRSAPSALIGLWNYKSETKDGVEFTVNWRDDVPSTDEKFMTVDWWMNDAWVNACR